MLVPGCMSCDVIAEKRTAPGGVIYQDDYWRVDSVVSPVLWRGFLIVKLKRHCEHLAELTPPEAAKVYVCSFGDGVKHIHLWVLPRPPEMRPGMHWVFLNLDLRALLTRRFGVKRWIVSDAEVAHIAHQLRGRFRELPRQDPAAMQGP